MSLWNYIQGHRRGREINRLEREAMQDPFLADALEGYDNIKSVHISQIEDLQKKIKQSTQPKGQSFRYGSIAATILLLIAIGGYFFFSKNQSKNDFNDFLVMESVEEESENFTEESEIASLQEEKVEIKNQEIPPVILSEDKIVQAEVTVAEPSVSRSEMASVASAEEMVEAQTNSVIKEESMVSLPAVADLADAKVKVLDKKLDSVTVGQAQYYVTERIIDPEEVSSATPKSAIGDKEYEKYLKRELIRPVDDDCKDVKGQVTLRFYVDNNGRPYNINIIRSLCPSADREAVRLINAGPGWSRGDKAVWIHVKF